MQDMTADLGVFLVDDHLIVRAGIRACLELTEDIAVIGEAANGQQALDQIAVLEPAGTLPHVVLMDLVMPGIDGIEATRQIKARWPDIEVVAVTSFIDTLKVRSALEAGAAGYLLKDADADEIANAIREAAQGQCHLDPTAGKVLAAALRAPRDSADDLTVREREVLAHLAAGATNAEIARKLGIAERTARTHVSSILAKLALSSRTQAALWAVRHKLPAPPEPGRPGT